MERCQELVRTYVATEGEETLKELVQSKCQPSAQSVQIQICISGINNQSITLLHIVKSLGEYLTSEDGKIREKGKFSFIY